MQDIVERLRAKKGDEGFTLIELLVVVVIIGILVAIAVPVYLNYRQGAADKSAQSDVRGTISVMEQYYTDNSNTYPASQLNQTGSIALDASHLVNLSAGTTLSIVVSGTTSYKICAHNANGTTNKHYVYDSSNGSFTSNTSGAFSLTTCS